MLETRIKLSGTWTKINEIFVLVSSVWEPVTQAYVKVAGIWEQVFTDIITSLFGTHSTHSRARINNICFAGVSIFNSGVEFTFLANGVQNGLNIGPWMDVGSVSDVFKRCTVNSGTIFGSPVDVWISGATSSAWHIKNTSFPQVTNGNITIEIALDAAGLDIIDSATYVLKATSVVV